MSKIKYIYIIILILALLSSTVVFADTTQNLSGIVGKEGFDLGYIDGRKESLKNMAEKKDIPYYLARPKESDVLFKYRQLLSDKEKPYQDHFYIDYIEGFDLGYEETIGNISTNKEIKTNYADTLGKALGEIYGFKDFYNGIKSNWSKSIPSNTNIIKMFNIEKQTSSYKSTFLSTFREGFKYAYEEGYEKANLEPKKVTLEAGISDGEAIGSILGKIFGSKDYFENKTNDYLRNIPKDTNIIGDYSLRNDHREYLDGFLIGFKRAYEKAYNDAFREANLNIHLRDESDAYEYGRNAGIAKGEILGSRDFIERKENNWKNHKFLSSNIITEYNLLYQSSKYRNGFVAGYWEGFAEGYANTYKRLSQEDLSKKSIVGNIPIGGGSISSPGGAMSLNIQKGTYYKDVTISIEKLLHNPYSLNVDRYIENSEIYNIQIGNRSNNYDNDKLIDISFEFYGKSNGGIYKRINDQWVYLNSKIEEGKITTSVKPSTLVGKENIFCVLIDKDIPLLKDIRSHWAKDEINALVRRNIIYGYNDNTFKPEKEIGRAEFLILLSRIYDWDLPTDTNNISNFKDYEKFGIWSKVISYGISKGYIKGYEDNTFKPNNPISYKEVEIIMGRILKDPNFKWYNTSAKMLYEKQTKSKSYNSMDNKISRAEASYMLYILNEWRY